MWTHLDPTTLDESNLETEQDVPTTVDEPPTLAKSAEGAKKRDTLKIKRPNFHRHAS